MTYYGWTINQWEYCALVLNITPCTDIDLLDMRMSWQKNYPNLDIPNLPMHNCISDEEDLILIEKVQDILIECLEKYYYLWQ